MSQHLQAERIDDSTDRGKRLASGYGQLVLLDQALREAERQLQAAHRCCGDPDGQGRAELLYAQVLVLRRRSQQVLAELAELWVADR